MHLTPVSEFPEIVQFSMVGEELSLQDTPAPEFPEIVQSRITGAWPPVTRIPPCVPFVTVTPSRIEPVRSPLTVPSIEVASFPAPAMLTGKVKGDSIA